jgi:hypothetical protein
MILFKVQALIPFSGVPFKRFIDVETDLHYPAVGKWILHPLRGWLQLMVELICRIQGGKEEAGVGPQWSRYKRKGVQLLIMGRGALDMDVAE